MTIAQNMLSLYVLLLVFVLFSIILYYLVFQFIYFLQHVFLAIYFS